MLPAIGAFGNLEAMFRGVVMLFLLFIVLLAGLGAYRVSLAVSAALCKRGSGWSWTAGILSFVVSFVAFFVGMVTVFGMFFGR